MEFHNCFGKDKRNNATTSTIKIFQKNRQGCHLRQPTDTSRLEIINAIATAQTSSNASGSSSAHFNSSATIDHNHSSSQHTNFSSRNKLRADLGTMDSEFTQPHLLDTDNANDIGLEREIEDISNYIVLNSDHFINNVGSYITCMLCGIKKRFNGNGSLEEHLTSEQHSQNLCRLKTLLLEQTPRESSIQMNALRELTRSWYEKYALTHDEYILRLEIINEFKMIIGVVDPECDCKIIGSLTSGTSLRNSDINLELIHPNSKLFEVDTRSKSSIHHKLVNSDAGYGEQINYHTLHYDLIPNAVDTLDKLRSSILETYLGPRFNFFEVISELDDLNKSVPKLVLRHLETSIRLEVCCYPETSHKLAVLLATYMSLDERARILSILVKYWSEVCEINKPERGTYTPHIFVILVIYYLQRTSPPVLPCLHEIVFKNPGPTGDPDDINDDEQDRLGVKSWSNSFSVLKERDDKIDMNDSQDNCTEIDDDESNDFNGEDNILIDKNNEEVGNLKWTSDNNNSVHMLFINFLKSMVKEFDDLRNVITIRTLRKITLSSKDWNYSKIKGIENPVKPTANLSRCVGNMRSFEYIKNCFTQGYYYLTSLPLDSELNPKDENQPYPQDFIELFINSRRIDHYYAMRERKIRSNSKDYDPVAEMVQQGLFDRDVIVVDALFKAIDRSKLSNKEFSISIANFYDLKLLKPRDVCATKFCRLCKKTGHLREGCGKTNRSDGDFEIENYDIDLDFNANLDPIFVDFYGQDSISPDLSNTHKRIVKKLTKLINSSTGLNCQLELFGSTVNNLGSFNSDLDICVTLRDDPIGTALDCVAILRQIHNVLETDREIKDIEAVYSARVPILKFMYSKFAIDLSMYNKCAIHNSKLLKAYAMIDKRVPQLFYLVKRYAKAFDIACAVQGSLSSYAWGIMVIHYLQRTFPPILPVLQETSTPGTPPMFGVNGWNVWFNRDIESISMERNDMTLTQLFKGFLLYFGKFEFNRYVISIRKSDPISKFLKNWHQCMMAIEDPFELTYNLSGRLDDRMALYIINSFALTFKHITNLQRAYLTDKKRLKDRQIFNSWQMTGGQKPPYRGCRLCHKIGHKVENCDQRNQRQERKRYVKNGHNIAK